MFVLFGLLVCSIVGSIRTLADVLYYKKKVRTILCYVQSKRRNNRYIVTDIENEVPGSFTIVSFPHLVPNNWYSITFEVQQLDQVIKIKTAQLVSFSIYLEKLHSCLLEDIKQIILDYIFPTQLQKAQARYLYPFHNIGKLKCFDDLDK